MSLIMLKTNTSNTDYELLSLIYEYQKTFKKASEPLIFN